MKRRNFLKTILALVAAVSLSCKVNGRGLRLEFVNEETFTFSNGDTVTHKLPHNNARKDTYKVYETDHYLGELRIHYDSVKGAGCSTYRYFSPVVEFETFFGLTVKDNNKGEGYRFPCSVCDAQPHSEKIILKIAKKMRNMSIAKMEDMIEKYNNGKY